MSKSFKLLPADTKTHLFKLITDKSYRNNADSASYDYKPQGDGKLGTPRGTTSVKKFGYNALLAAGTASRDAMGGRDPGRYRIVRVIESRRESWWIGEHVPANTYKFHKISGIPRCPTCKGTSDQICPDCQGTATTRQVSGRNANFIQKSRCKTCHSKGVRKCPDCSPHILVDGHTVISDMRKW